MISNIDFYSYVSAFNYCEKVSDDLILSVTKNSNNKLRDILILSPNNINANFTFEEKKNYIIKLLNQFNNLFEANMTEEDKTLYTIFLLKDSELTQDTISYFEKINNIYPEQNSWKYTLKEFVQYLLLNFYLRSNYHEKLKDLTDNLKSNNDKFKKDWNQLVQEAYKIVKE